MPRPCHRAHLDSGLKLNINRLARQGLLGPPGSAASASIQWTDGYTGSVVASATITCSVTEDSRGSCEIKFGNRRQHISITARRCHFGGRQWYFICPYMNRRVSVLWMPPGAHTFACRQRWGRQVAYATQFMDRTNRAHRGQARIRNRLCSAGGFDPDEWDFP